MVVRSNMTLPQEFVFSAPGSAIIVGEHAVLHGYPAIVAAMKERLQVRLSCVPTSEQNNQVMVSSMLGQWQGSWQDAFALALTPALASAPTPDKKQHPLRFVFACLWHFLCHQYASSKNESNPRFEPNNTAISIQINSQIDSTLGFGSSAALTVALTGALHAWLYGGNNKASILTDAVSIICSVQDSGSGADAAASCYGGLVRYDAKAITGRLLLVSDTILPVLRLLYVGYKTPTPEVIAKVAQWADLAPEKYTALYGTMGDCVNKAEAAIVQRNWFALAEAMNQYQQLMVALGVCDKATQEAIDAAVGQANTQPEAAPWACKISGSGLGDCVLCLGIDEVADWPHQQTAMIIDVNGLIRH